LYDPLDIEEKQEPMTRSELIKRMSEKLDQLSVKDVDLAVQTLIEVMSNSLAAGERIEIRGFGTFSNHYRKEQMVRNPKTGEQGIFKPGKYVPHFKPGKDLRLRVNQDPGPNEEIARDHREAPVAGS